jgi:hypothetical protein
MPVSAPCKQSRTQRWCTRSLTEAPARIWKAVIEWMPVIYSNIIKDVDVIFVSYGHTFLI